MIAMALGTLQHALSLHQAGRLREAEAGYRQVLATQPGNADALHYLGLIAHQSGRHQDAADLIRQAIATRARPAFWYNLAQVHLAQADTSAAEQALRQTIAMAPDHAEALFHLGALCRMRQDIVSAIDCYRRALASKPGFVDAHVNLGLLLNDAGDAQKAAEHLEAADRLRPNDPAILNNLGMVHKNVAPLDAIRLFERALALAPRLTNAATNLAKLLCSLARHDEAIQVLENTLTVIGDDGDVHMLLASICADFNQVEDAIVHCEKAAAAAPDAAHPLVALGNVHRRVGQFEKAYDYYRRAQSLEPENCGALVGILKHLKSHVPEKEVALIANRACDPMVPVEQRRQLHFALSECREAAGHYDDAFYHMNEGNKLRRTELEAKSGPYNPEVEVAGVDNVIATFDAHYFRRVAGFGIASNLPVFIVGMPRSGTTLCEQILASHSQVFGADELPDIGRIAAALRSQFAKQTGHASNEAYATHLTADIVRSIAERHLGRLKALSAEAARIVDKMPMNYRRLGLIATLFPKARIIHCHRNPLDTGLSCFGRDLALMPIWASDLRAIGHVYRGYERLMAHWRRVLPIEILEFTYEDVVEDLEGSARRLIDYCGLAWEENCLEFHRTDRQVKTASIEQVRRPIYASSVGRWKRFEQHLAPLLEALRE